MGGRVVLPSLMLAACIFGPMLSLFYLVSVEGVQVLDTAVKCVPYEGVGIPLIASPSCNTDRRMFKKFLENASALAHIQPMVVSEGRV